MQARTQAVATKIHAMYLLLKNSENSVIREFTYNNKMKSNLSQKLISQLKEIYSDMGAICVKSDNVSFLKIVYSGLSGIVKNMTMINAPLILDDRNQYRHDTYNRDFQIFLDSINPILEKLSAGIEKLNEEKRATYPPPNSLFAKNMASNTVVYKLVEVSKPSVCHKM